MRERRRAGGKDGERNPGSVIQACPAVRGIAARNRSCQQTTRNDVHGRGNTLVTADLDRALLAWPLMVSLITIFGTAGFVLLSAGERVFDLRAAAASLLTLWQVLAAVVFLASPLVLLNVTADMGGVSWTSAVALLPEVLTETHAGRVFEWLLPIAFAFLLSACVPVPQTIRTTALFLLAGVLLLLQAMLSHAIDKGALAVTLYFLHETAVGLWVGALLTLWMVARYGKPPDIWVEHLPGVFRRPLYGRSSLL
jgi:putative copper export protein